MRSTVEGSSAKDYFRFTCITTSRIAERAKADDGKEKDNIFDENTIFQAYDGEIREDNTLQKADGSIVELEANGYETVKENRRQKFEKGIVLNYEELKKLRQPKRTMSKADAKKEQETR